MPITDKQIELFASLFRGREDVFARRWSKGDKSGYMPAYDVNWEVYKKHKAFYFLIRISFRVQDLAI